MGTFILKPKKKVTSRAASVEQLDIINEGEEEDGAGGVRREGAVLLKTTDTDRLRPIRLAVKVQLRPVQQTVQSLQLWDGIRWNDMVPGQASAAVARDATTNSPPGRNHYWTGFLIPAAAVPRPFIATYTKFQLSNALPSAQRIEWMAAYDPDDFSGPHVRGHSDVGPHPLVDRKPKKKPKKAPSRGRSRR